MVEHSTIDIGKVSAQTRLGSNVDSWRINKSTDVTAHHNHSMDIKYDNLSLKFSVESISNQIVVLNVVKRRIFSGGFKGKHRVQVPKEVYNGRINVIQPFEKSSLSVH